MSDSGLQLGNLKTADLGHFPSAVGWERCEQQKATLEVLASEQGLMACHVALKQPGHNGMRWRAENVLLG